MTTIGDYAFAGCTRLKEIVVNPMSSSFSSLEGVLFNKSQTTLIRFPEGKAGDYSIPSSVTRVEPYSFSGCTALTGITIPETVATIGRESFAGCVALASVVIPGSIKHLEAGVFQACTGLTNVTISNGVEMIGHGAFNGCASLTSISIPESVTSIRSGAFSNCAGLASVTLPSSVKVIEFQTFANCTGLTSVVIPNGVTTIENEAFSGCSSLASITIPNSATTIKDAAFIGCKGLVNISVDSSNSNFASLEGILFNKSQTKLLRCPEGIAGDYTIPQNVTAIGDYAFINCKNLTGVSIPNSVRLIGDWAFSGCSGLANVTLPDSVTDIGGSAFLGCIGLTDVVIPKGVTFIRDGAFRECTGLASITIPSSVSSISGGLFFGCTSLRNVTISNNVTTIGYGAFRGCTNLTNVLLPPALTTISDYAFVDCTGLTNVAIPTNVKTVGEGAFFNCTRLVTVSIPRSVTTMGVGTFQGCAGLVEIVVDSENPSYASDAGVLFDKSRSTLLHYPAAKAGGYRIPPTVTSIRGTAFSGCTGLTSIVIPRDVTIAGFDIALEGYEFSTCPNLAAIEVDPMDTNLSSLDGVLFNKAQTTLLRYPQGKDGSYIIPKSVTALGGVAFDDCHRLTSVSIPKGVTLEGYEFRSCTRLTEIMVDPLSTENSSLDGVLFDKSRTALLRCPEGKAGSYAIPSGVTSIRSGAFSGCTQLTSVIIPSSVTSIGTATFFGCSRLAGIYFEGPPPNNAPSMDSGAQHGLGTRAPAYYLPGSTGWGLEFGFSPMALWRPKLQTATASIDVRENRFVFDAAWASGQTVVIEAATDLAQPVWTPLQTNAFTGAVFRFVDPEWMNSPARFYRLRAP